MHYVTQSIKSSYFEYKNTIVAETFRTLKVKKVLDLGANVNSIVKKVGLRSKLENYKIDYLGLDLDGSYFSTKFIDQISYYGLDIYTSAKGIVGNIEDMPFNNNSIEAISVLDVLEHVDNPRKAIDEIKRVLVKGGCTIFILPSLYKIDLFDFDYVGKKRKSTHISRMTILEWQSLIESGDLHFDDKLSRGVGILSGLSYLLWLDDSFVPTRITDCSEEIHNPKSIKHKKIRNIFSKHDHKTDMFFSQDLLKENFICKIISNPDILMDCLSNYSSQELKTALGEYISLLKQIKISQKNKLKIDKISSEIPYYALANSAMLIYRNEK